jgi:signal transduction histidine kinase
MDRNEVSALADLAVSELAEVFEGVHVAMHLLANDSLELVARRLDGIESLDGAPDWLRWIPLTSEILQARVARGRAMIVKPLEELSPVAQEALGPRGVRHLVVVPLVVAEVVVGTLSVGHCSATQWDSVQLKLLETVSRRLAGEIAQLRLLEEERRRTRDLALVNEIGGLIAGDLDLDKILRTAVHELARVLDVPRVKIVLADAERKNLESVACSQEIEANLTIPIGSQSTSSLAFTTKEALVIPDAANDPRVLVEKVRNLGVRSIMAVPLIAKGEAIGAILVAETRRRRAFTEEEVARATAVANLVSPAIANARMFADLKQSYEALGRAQEDLVSHERLAALGELSAVIAHEVRNPLAVIFNSLGTLRRIAATSEDARVLLDIVGEEAARLNRIVGNLLDFARPYTAHPRQTSLEAIIRDAIDAARRSLPSSSISVVTELRLVECEAIVDATMIQQALINLVVNAIQATPAGGTVTVEARSDASTLRIAVSDEGPGVPAADAARLFQPFFTTKATGTGLGLAVVRRIMDALGGHVDVCFDGERGAIFTLVVPLETVPRDAARAS